MRSPCATIVYTLSPVDQNGKQEPDPSQNGRDRISLKTKNRGKCTNCGGSWHHTRELRPAKGKT
ncbi:hypothetical protein DPMN_055399 [Dreissena polymorpha]|uniref:Uncharacterized protein n=1 Tax=Dreissena polymorpha TaxID=45954 RepID=A0A9D4CSB5_DREPO|nr:hypothetical protein DPMN_055399 [Dreissena polymorpha]